MMDATTQKPLHVSTDETTGPYIMVPVSQLAEVEQLLDKHEVRYWVEEDVISMDGGPEIVVIDLGRTGNAKAVQAILVGV